MSKNPKNSKTDSSKPRQSKPQAQKADPEVTNSRKNSQLISKNPEITSNQIPPIIGSITNPQSITNPDSIVATKDEKSNENRLKLLNFFTNTPKLVGDKTKSTYSSLYDKINVNVKPTNRFMRFFSFAAEQIQNKLGEDFTNFQKNFVQRNKFDEDQKQFIADLEKLQKTEEKSSFFTKKQSLKGLKNVKKPKEKSIDASLQQELDPIEKLKAEEKEAKRKKLIEAEKKKMIIEQKIREIEKEIHSIESSVSQRILEETSAQNIQIIKILEGKKKEEAVISAAELTKKMNKFKKDQELKRQRQREEFDKELALRLESEKKRKDESVEKMKEDKKLLIMEKIEKINKRREQRKIQQDTSISLIKQSRSHYQQTLTSIEKKVEKNIEIPELERKKKDLETRRNLYKPIDGNEIKAHAKKYEEIKKLREEESRMKVIKEEEEKKNVKKYDSIFMRRVIEKDVAEKGKTDKDKEDRKKLIEKKQKYQSIIKDLFKPKVDLEKRKEIENRIIVGEKKDVSLSRRFADIEPIGETLENSGDINHIAGLSGEINEQPIAMGNKPKSEFSGGKSRKKLKINYELPWKTIKQQQNLRETKNPEIMNQEFMKTEMEANKNSKKYENYLKEVRSQRELLEAKGVIRKNQGWDKYIKDENLDSHDRYLSVITTANNIENKAKMKEEMVLKSKKNDLNVQDEINDLYLESIKAKLALLNLAPKSK